MLVLDSRMLHVLQLEAQELNSQKKGRGEVELKQYMLNILLGAASRLEFVTRANS